jgi:hypothetical protein
VQDGPDHVSVEIHGRYSCNETAWIFATEVNQNILMRLYLLVTTAFIVGCAPIQQKTNISTAVAQRLVAGVGDVVLRAEGRESMPNVFGGADIFGRTRPTGFETVQFGGMQGNKVVLLRSGVATQSDATTMNSTGMVLPTQQQTTLQGSVGMTPVAATATTNGAVYIPPSGSTSASIQTPTIPVVVDWRASPRVPALGHTIVIEDANATALVYRIE